MKAMALFAPAPAEENPLKLVDLALPEPQAGQILIDVDVCGVCHTDLHTAEGEIHPAHLPVVPGHQAVGRVVQIGRGVEKFKAGDRAGVPWLYSADRVCSFCQRGEENLCPQARFTGFHVNGGYAQYLLAEADYALPVPDELSTEQAAPLLCAGIIGLRSLRKADLQPGERLGLFGFGASAHLAIQIARYWGCEVAVFTRAEAHRRHALDLGAAWAGDAAEDGPFPLDRAVLFAPVGRLVPLALERIRPGGTVAINAIHLSPIPEMPYATIYGERTLRSVANATYQDGLDLLDLALKIPLHSTINVYPLEGANQALQDLKASRFNGEAVLQVM
ncbi:MAG TPA: zinc-dependent alcohol dehydrogenase family protein [Anaerolineaceae bacterium]|nr:zinc-dependent alcohol dehydrogenase family protein [Anaerolineaceae bacterium]